MKIIGLDVGRATVVAAALDHFPENPRAYFNSHRREFVRLISNRQGKADRQGKQIAQAATKLLAMQPDAIVMEPTGVWYSEFWRILAERNGIAVYWVGHADLAAERGSYGFKNKRDDEDAFCLALCAWNPRFIDAHGRKRFLQFDFEGIGKVRECYFRLKQIDKLKTAAINHTRQRLTKEFPEISQRQAKPSASLGFSALWGWLAGLHTYARIENEYRRSLARELGIEISLYTRDHAGMIVHLELRETKTETELRSLLGRPEFLPYRRVFAQFGFGLRNEALLLSQCYPFDKFLLQGRPWVEWEENRKNKLQKRHRSLRSFQLYLGVGYVKKQSGDKESIKLGGSDLVRSALYMWALDRVFPKKRKRLATRPIQALSMKLDELNESQIPGKNKVIRILFRATRILFQELWKELGE